MERKTRNLILRGVRLKIAFHNNLYEKEIVSNYEKEIRKRFRLY